MTQAELDRAVANTTGESLATIRQLGFGIADPVEIAFDPEPYEGRLPKLVDWDAVDAQHALACA
ncbi:MAG: hypothetical protein RJP95_04135 [Pirellulales bacterium]